MSIVTTDNRFYSEIAAAIRGKNGESTGYLPADMAPAILSIEGNSGYTVTVRHCGANAIVTARHGMTQETAIADANGVAVFEKLNKGVWFFTSPSRENAVAEILGRTDLDFEAEVFNPSPNGLIICTTPNGSTVTATNGTTIFTADKTLMGENEIHVISIKPEYFSTSPITVTCVKADGTSTTQEVVIDSKKDVELGFERYELFVSGDSSKNQFSIWSGSPTLTTDYIYINSQGSTSYGVKTPLIDLSKYSRLHVDCVCAGSASTYLLAISGYTAGNQNLFEKLTSNKTREVITVDVSAVNVSTEIRLWNRDGNRYAEVYNVWLE